MRIDPRLRAAKYSYIALSVVICIFGVCLIAVPEFSMTMICRIGGILLMIFGCIKILSYMSRDLYRLAFQFDLAFGILLLILGLLLVLKAKVMIHIICGLLGILTLADSLLKVQTSIDAREFGLQRWWMILVVSILTALIGIFLLFRPLESVRLAMILSGAAFLGEGILNLVTVLTAVKLLKRKAPDEFETENFKY